MKVLFKASFKKDLKRVKDPKLLGKINDTIHSIKAADTPTTISSLLKMKGYDEFYRVRLGDFRLGLRMTADTVIFIRCLHRKEIYRFFP